jgi:hypothetical protein
MEPNLDLRGVVPTTSRVSHGYGPTYYYYYYYYIKIFINFEVDIVHIR